MLYAIKQSYWDKSGNSWKKMLKNRYKTYKGAEKAADRSCWQCVDPATKEVFEASSAEIVEVRK